MKFLQILTFYEKYLQQFYAAHPELARASFREQTKALIEDGFGASHLFANHLSPYGYDAELIIVNCPEAQAQWCRENNCSEMGSPNWLYTVTKAQIEQIKPDILYLSDPITFDSRFIRSLSPRPKHVFAWRAATIPPETDFREMDLILTSDSVSYKKIIEHGARAVEFFVPGEPARFGEVVANESKEYDVVFYGQCTHEHLKRRELLTEVGKAPLGWQGEFSIAYFISAEEPAKLPAGITMYNRGSRWGLEMRRAIRRGRIALNVIIDFANAEAGNMRQFEVTGTGTFLLTQYHDSVKKYFEPGVEVETFRDTNELIEKVYYYLAHPDEREAIARRGQERFLKDHSMERRVEQLHVILERYTRKGPTEARAQVQSTRPTMESLEKAVSLLNSGNPEAALAEIPTWANSAEEKAGTHYLRALAYGRLGNLTPALTDLKELLTILPRHQHAARLLEELEGPPMGSESGAPIASQTASYSYATKEHFMKPVPTSPGLAESQETTFRVNQLIDAALELLERKQTQEAFVTIENASRFGQLVRDLEHVRAMCFISMERLSDAHVALKKELQAFPDNEPAGELLRQVAEELNRSSGGSAEVRSPQANQPKSMHDITRVQALAHESMTLLHGGKPVDALHKVEEAVSHNLYIPGLYQLLAHVLEVVGRCEEALVAVTRELEANPSNQDARSLYERLQQSLQKQKPIPLHPEQRSYQSAVPQAVLKSIQNATHNYAYRGVPMIKNPFDFALYPLLLWNVKPKTIIEIGSKDGGSALWFGDMAMNFGLDMHIYSIDIVQVSKVSHPRVTFMEGNGRDLGQVLRPEFLARLPRPLLVIEDADHSYDTSSAVLKFFDSVLGPEEYIIIEDGIISDLDGDPNCNSGPHRALKEFIQAHPGEYQVDENYNDFFGYNFTWCTNGFLKKKKYALNRSIPKPAIAEFLSDDSASQGVESQMSPNERFQLHYAIRNFVKPSGSLATFLEIGSHAGASLLLSWNAINRFGVQVHGFAVEPDGQPQFHEILRLLGKNISHVKAFSNEAAPALKEFLDKERRQFDFMFIDGDHTYEGVRDDIRNYYPFLKPGGIMLFHDFLPALTPENKEAIFFHHGGKEPGIRQACQELMEQEYRCEVLDLPLLYPTDQTQTQPHLPAIPGVYSTVRGYRKRG